MNSTSHVNAVRSRLSGPDHSIAITQVVNVAYLTGFENVFDTEDAHIALITEQETVLLTDSRYIAAASAAADGTAWTVLQAREDLLAQACREAEQRGMKTLAVEDSVSQGTFKRFNDAFAGEVVAVHEWVEEVRQVKSAEEIRRIEAAQALTDRAFDHLLSILQVGRSEAEIALDLEFFLRREGSEGVAFAPIVASGPNSALPHAKVTDRTLAPGDFVKMDFGARVDGYCADMTRTVVMGHASDRHREIYETVLAANDAGIAAVEAGRPGRAIDAAARAVIEAAGFGSNFGHGLGHGVGREVHELPGVGPRSAKPVPLGSVVTIEPGVYIEGFGGVRIEDLIVVESDGARVLSSSPKTLFEV